MRGPLTPHRYVGLAGSVTLAAGCLQIGARPGTADTDGLPSLAETPALLACLVGLTVLTGVWWRVLTGEHRLTGRWVVVTAALWTLPLLAAPPLASRDAYAYLCQGAVVNAGLSPYVTSPADLPCPWLDSVPPVWREATSPYGPLAAAVSAGAAAVADATGRVEGGVDLLRLFALGGVVLAAWAGRRLARAGGVDDARAGWLALAGPLVLVHAIGGAHLDALMAGLVLAALAIAAGPSRPGRWWPGWSAVVAGALLGAAVGVKATAVVAVPFAALLARRGPGLRGLLAPLAAVGAATAAGYATLAVPNGLGLGFLRALPGSAERAQWTSPPSAVGMTVDYALRAFGVRSDAPIVTARAVGLVLAAAIVVAAWWHVREPGARPDAVRRVVAAAGIGFAALALLGPVFYPWYALTPLALLAVSTSDERARAWIAGATAPLAYLILPNGVGLAPRTKLPGALAVTAGLAAAAGWATRRARRRSAPTRPTATGS
jgi:alpha-1,6-mannosyltransferase